MQKRIAAHLLAAIFLQQLMMAQTAHRIPCASGGNTIKLTVANGSPLATSKVKVEATNVPSWLRFAQTEQILHALKAGEESAATFSFSIDPSTPVNQEHRLQFHISTVDGQRWSKEIVIVVAAPERFELFQNYPNPFNPSTVIGYQLPVTSWVTLKVFNVLGQEVATLVDGEKAAGHHEEVWNASGFASGMYVYQIAHNPPRGIGQIFRKTMLLLK
jgi:hypothetical protein